ncbi:MAG: NADH-quinone oxidoreductase subunit N [Candidatus Aminicenantes bacterium]|nr:NADH-quinone oxidoreductase subunit N [Candidatus Aminicenantes bacterium]
MTSWPALLPLAILAAGALILLVFEAFLKSRNKAYQGYAALAFVVSSGAVLIVAWDRDWAFFRGSLRLDNFGILLGLILTAAAAFVVLLGLRYVPLAGSNIGEFYPLLLFALSGAVIMLTTTNLLVVFLGLEVLSVSSYALAGLRLHDEKSSEAALKYFLLGSFASAVFVFGLALSFGASKSFDISALFKNLRPGSGTEVLGLAGLAFLLAGLAFKMAVVPFHMWTPDVYQGAPTPVAAFFSVGPKAVGFAVLLRLTAPLLGEGLRDDALHGLLTVLAVLTLIVPNLAALRQTDIKRLLAYSSIAHAGYLLLAVLAGDPEKLVFYLIVYLFMNVGAFAAVTALCRKDEERNTIEDFAGLGFQSPWLGALFSVFLLSLAGFPPTAGFLAKFYVFSSAARAGLVPLVILAVLASLVSVYYYLKVVVVMYMRPAPRATETDVQSPALLLVLFLCLYGVLQLGVNPGALMHLIRRAVAVLL